MHVAQGRTVDTAHLLVTGSLSRQALYVGMTRGREANTAHVVTGSTAPPGREPYQQAALESVLVGVLQRDAGDLSATEPIRQAQDWAGGTGHLLNLWSAAVRHTLYPDIDQQITARLTGSEAWRYQHEHSRKAAAAATSRPARRARHQRAHRPDHGRPDGRRPVHLQRPARPPAATLHLAGQPDVTWAQRTPASAPAVANELAAALDDRRRALGARAADPEPWLARQLGVLPGPGLPRAARRIRPPRGPGRRLPGSRRDHQPRTGRLPRAAPRQPRSRSHA